MAESARTFIAREIDWTERSSHRAMALANDLVLVTRKVKEFGRSRGYAGRIGKTR